MKPPPFFRAIFKKPLSMLFKATYTLKHMFFLILIMKKLYYILQTFFVYNISISLNNKKKNFFLFFYCYSFILAKECAKVDAKKNWWT